MLDPRQSQILGDTVRDLVGAVVDEFMSMRDRYAPKYTIRREMFDGAVSVAVIDAGAELLIAELALAAIHKRIAKDVVSNLLKLLYDLESRRFERNADHTDGHDFREVAKTRAKNYCSSEIMKALANNYETVALWRHSSAREASRRVVTYMFNEHGHEHNNHPPHSRW